MSCYENEITKAAMELLGEIKIRNMIMHKFKATEVLDVIYNYTLDD